MTTDNARKEQVRARMAATGKPYTAAARDVELIQNYVAGSEYSYAEAEAQFDDPRNQLLCATCGWTMGMICPECEKGCGCEYRCTGWRHKEWNEPDDEDAGGCPECGAGSAGDPYQECICLP